MRYALALMAAGAMALSLLPSAEARLVSKKSSGVVKQAGAGLPAKALELRLRAGPEDIRVLQDVSYITTSTATRVTRRENVVLAVSVNTTGTIVQTSTNTLGPIVRPSRLAVTFFDSGGGSTIRCQDITIRGTDQNGVLWEEIFAGESLGTPTSIQEAQTVVSDTAFATVSYVRLRDCAGGGASDLAVVYPAIPALQFPIKDNGDILSVCRDRGAVCLPGSSFTVVSGPSANTIDIGSGFVPVSGTGDTYSHVPGDSYVVHYRGNQWAP